MSTMQAETRRPGRPSNAELQARSAAAPTRAETVTVERRSKRGGALDVGAQLKMALPDAWYAPGGRIDSKQWVSRWVNDDGGNLWNLQNRDDYEFVPSEDGEEAAALGFMVDQRADGTRISMPVGRKEGGGELRAYLMRKPLDFWQQHQGEILDIARRTERARLSGEDNSANGGGGLSEHAYTPDGNSLRRETVKVDYNP